MNKRSVQVLVVDDEEGIRHGLATLFEKQGFAVTAAAAFEEALRIVETGGIDVAVMDIRLRDERTGLELIRKIRTFDPDIVSIVITGYGSIDTAVAAMKEGACDYIVKPIDSIRLIDSVARSVELRTLKNENSFLRRELYGPNRGSREFVTQNRSIRLVLEKADKIKDTAITSLITGETGTGKEVLARYIHFTSNRRDAQFVSINCAALSETLLLSELFGHERGAFTGAVDRKPGKFEVADGGTLFLDEIGDMPLEIQAKLLRVLEESAFERVGGTRRIAVDVRIIAATNKDLPAFIAEGRFREDLYYRINIVSFHLPPLRERREDIPLLVEYFLKKYSDKYKKTITALSDDLDRELVDYHWPGNVRELENLINQAVLLSDSPIVHTEGFFEMAHRAPAPARTDSGSPAPTAVTDNATAGPAIAPAPTAGATLKDRIDQVTAEHERAMIVAALAGSGNNKSRAARTLGITRKTLARKIARYGIGRFADR